MRDTLGAILKRDYRVLTVSSGEAALTLLKQEDIDLILLDVRLPGISGFDVLRIVKENYSLVECIMISAINEVETAGPGDEARRLSLHHEELRLRRAAFACSQRRASGQDLNRQVITLSAQIASRVNASS
jgi:CheY-like chemotaxis protein